MEESRQLQKELDGARELVESLSPGDELYQMAAVERSTLGERLQAIEQDIKVLLLPRDPNDSRNVFLEIRAGTGGDEAALFAAELFRMYQRYAERRRWKVEIVDRDDTGIGGIKTITALIEGDGAFSRLKFEGGVHRVQRVPATEASGRIHTSSASTDSAPRAPAVRA
jgi:peptide chain release factor 1